MQPYVCNMSDYSFLRKMFYLTSSISIAEIITYPLDRIKTLLYAKPTYFTKSFLGYQEFHLISLEIFNVEKFFGFFYGLKAGFDRTFSFLLPKFFIFFYLMKQRKSDEISYFQLFKISIISHTLSGLTAQMSNVLKIKLQGDPIVTSNIKKVDSISLKYIAMSEIYSKDNVFLFRCGLGTSLLSLNIMGLCELFGFILFKKAFDQFSIIENNKIMISVVLSTVVATLASHPVEILHNKIVLTELQGTVIKDLKSFVTNLLNKSQRRFFYQGILPNLLRNCCFNAILIYILMRGIKFEEKKKIYRDHLFLNEENLN